VSWRRPLGRRVFSQRLNADREFKARQKAIVGSPVEIELEL
jgi:hypothetical protein